MTSEDKANWYMSWFPNQDMRAFGHLIGLLDNHAAEAKAEQREACANAITEHFATPKKFMSLQEVCLNAVEKSDV